MELSDVNQSWLEKNIKDDISPNTRYQFNITMALEEGDIVKTINFDLCWYIMIQFEGDSKLRLNLICEILKNTDYLNAFKEVIANSDAKRTVAEFLIFNPEFLIGLKEFIDFTVLNDPIDFIAHVLFIKYGSFADSPTLDEQRVKNVQAVLSTGFKLSPDAKEKNENTVIRKILYMEPFKAKFVVIRGLLRAGFVMFGTDPNSNKDLAVEMIKLRKDAICQMLIKENSEGFKRVSVQIPGNDAPGNIADYFYWVHEDMQAVKFIKEFIGVELTG